jgi:hypothetical protein
VVRQLVAAASADLDMKLFAGLPTRALGEALLGRLDEIFDESIGR